MIRKSRKSLDELTDIAYRLIAGAFANHEVPRELRSRWVLGSEFDNDHAIFELYVPGETPRDAVLLSRVRLDRVTGEGSVEVYNLAKKR